MSEHRTNNSLQKTPGGRANGRIASRVLVYALLIATAAAYVLPFIWMFSTSIKPEDQAASADLSLLPRPISSTAGVAIENYRTVWNDPAAMFPVYLRNTLIVCTLSVIGMVLSSAIAAYGFSRLRWKGRDAVFGVVLATMMVPFPVLMVPLFKLFSEFGWVGSLKPLWIPAFFGHAFNIFLLRQFFLGIPRELDEAATIDGCSHWRIFWNIVLPLSKPALVTVALFHFTFVWNDFLAPLIFLTNQEQFTLALGLQLYQGKAGNTPWNLLMAASTLVVAPLLILFLIAQKTFFRSALDGGGKE
jgi:multiple sugar transport system permease protein